MMNNIKWVFFVFFLVLLSSIVHANVNLINSRDWKDVYSVMLYSSLVDESSYFINSMENVELVLNMVSDAQPLSIFSSRRNPFAVGYGNIAKSRGYNVVEEIIEDNANAYYAERLRDKIKKFIIVDDSYGYNAISVANYAILDKYYVLFADKTTIRALTNFLDSIDVEDIIIYGTVDREVRTALQKYNPEVINYDGDRFLNNIEIAKKFMKISPRRQIVFTNGDFIEKSIVGGDEPVLFIGGQSVPQAVKNYIDQSEIATAILVGNDLIITATQIKEALGVSVFVKFAQSSKQGGAIGQVEALDMFLLPRYTLQLNATNVAYNKATRQLEVTIRNLADLATYFSGTYTIRDSDGLVMQTAGDTDTMFIEANDLKTLIYDLEEPLAEKEGMSVDAYVVYGESKNALDRTFQGNFPLDFIDVSDSSAIDIIEVAYDRSKQEFLVKVKNIGSMLTYVDAEVRDLLVNDVTGNYGTEDIISLKPGASGIIKIPVVLNEQDIAANPKIKVRAYYGERSDALVKMIEKEFEFKLKGIDWVTYAALAVIIILLILLIIARKKKKEKEKHSKS